MSGYKCHNICVINSRIFVALTTILIMLMTCVNCGGADYSSSFDWLPSPWSKCGYKEPGSCCNCYKTRTVACVYSSTKEEVPPFYCHKSTKVRPATKQPCTPCIQSCVLTLWTPWSACTDDCTPGTQHRTRTVVIPPQDGGDTCGPLVELRECEDPSLPLCIVADLTPQYQWKVGGWSSCRKQANDSSCGPGIRDRAVTCENLDSETVANNFCHYYLHGAEPVDKQLCSIPCDCMASPWSDWGPCSKTCHKGAAPGTYHGYQVRTRSVTRAEEEGGAGCDPLKDTKTCDVTLLPKCPRYVWHSSSWGRCSLANPDRGVKDCGPGVQTRDVYCILEGDSEYQPVGDVLCVQDQDGWANQSTPFKPPERRACQVPCPVDCVLGEWENWSACTQSCGNGGIRIRTRPIAQEMTEGGQPCGTRERYEERSCDYTPCSWWHTGQWSGCQLQFIGTQSCGQARQVRTVYCLNALDEVIEDHHCDDDQPKPISTQDCWVQCPGDCQASDWSSWGTCSETCGVKGGTQTRTRQIVDRGTPDTPCPLSSDLVQSRTCNQRACKVALWQVSEWGVCEQVEAGTEAVSTGSTEPAPPRCGEMGSGRQTRQLTCQVDAGYSINTTYCATSPRPTTSQPCAAPCPQDCKLSAWGDWSLCNGQCGQNIVKYKYRVVLRWPMYGGKECQGNPDKNGIIMKKRPCNNKKYVSCGAAQWSVTDWGACEVKGQDEHCGKGIESRNVTCVKDGREVNNGICYEEGIGAPPPSVRACRMVCAGDCRLSAWSAYTPCSQTCGDTPGIKTRSRYVINWDPSRSLEAQCPHLTSVPTVESVPCVTTSCPAYHWVTSPWHSCMPHSDDDLRTPSCGHGTQTRHVLCRQDNNSYVPDHRCDIVSAMPRRQQTCHVSCPADCQVSAWTEWSNCSQVCGDGLRHRRRHMIAPASHGGRQCPVLQDVTTCVLRDCNTLDWEVSTWGKCTPNWGMHCGAGTQLRRVVCAAGTDLEPECEKRKPKPDPQIDCYMPCQGDCVMAEWSVFSPCNCNVDSPRQTRTRQIIREALSSAVQCGAKQETQRCDCPSYQLVIGGWTNCQVFESANEKRECGKGIQKRPVNCIRADTGLVVHLSNCRLGNLTLSQSCEVACPEDCEVTEYTPWSACSEECGVEAAKTRSAGIVRRGNKLGKQCPGNEKLYQSQVCSSAPCYNYTFSRGAWSGCGSQGAGDCGISRETRDVTCVRSDGAVVQDVYCLVAEYTHVTSLDDLTQKEAAELDLDTERSCGEPCPGDCVVTEWSEFGQCIQNCSHGNVGGYQTRSRAIIRPSLGGSPCPWDIIQTRSCPAELAVCPVFIWETGKWNERNRRKVQCVLNGGLAVSGGCVPETQPSKHVNCSDTCGQFAECIEGKCRCEPGYSGDGKQCLPEFGCATDVHCFLNNTYCDVMNKECLCWDETLPGTDLLCSQHGAEASTNGDPLEELNQLFIYILIGCLISLLVLGIVTVACMVSHSKRRKKNHKTTVEANKLTKIDNLDTTPRNNDITKPQPGYVAKMTDVDSKNMARSWQNHSPYGHLYNMNLTRASSENDTGRGDSTTNSSPAFSQTDRKLSNLADLDEDLFSEDEMSRQPFLPPRGEPAQRPNVVLRVPSSRSVHSSSDNSSRLSTFRPDESITQSSPSVDSEVTAIWVPQNDLSVNEPTRQFPVIPNNMEDTSPRTNRHLTRTPPDMYENVLPSPESAAQDSEPSRAQQSTPVPIPAPRSPRRGPPPPVAPKPSPENVQQASGRPVSRRHNTEPVPSHHRNGMLFPRGDSVAPAENDLLVPPQHGLTESNSAKDLNDMRRVGPPGRSAPTQDLMQYCDEVLADLQNLANS